MRFGSFLAPLVGSLPIMLLYRLATGAALIAALVAVLIFDERFAPWYPMWLITASVVMVLAAREVIGLLAASGSKASTGLVIGGVLAMVASNWVPHVLGQFAYGSFGTHHRNVLASADAMSWPMWTFASIVMLAFIDQASRFRVPGEGAVNSVAATILACAYVGVLGSFMIQLRWVGGDGSGLIALAFVVAVAKGSDTGAYTVGRLAGRHKLVPRLSPNKTVEGAIGGIVFGVIAALVAVAWANSAKMPTFSWPAAIGFGLVVGCAAQVGDLMESMIKRDGERKDASQSLPGFGGILDVIDSLLFAGPVAYGYWLAFGL